MMGIEPLILQMYQRRMVKILLATFARMLIVSSFLADALHICQYWRLEQSILNMNCRCGLIAAGVCINLLAIGQFIGSVLIVTRMEINLGTGLLWLASHLRLAVNPSQWSVARYFQLCNLISALLVIMLRSQRTAVVAFLLLTYMNCKDMERLRWYVLYNYGVKLLVAFILVGYRQRVSAGLMVLLLSIHCVDMHIWQDSSLRHVDSASRENFWHKVSVSGGVIFIAVKSRHYHSIF
ncbi:uncharacterized protein LOC6536828 [Drosophila yakuba]|uniref:Surfeit locus protein 4 n=1 Tax=Drosophila yakuba TaxID=7245 RepID=B4PPA4_DROYA|nr:uncharacterized protein LOC6536828 [Drosophila yakuba]EDW97110.1 uncharacterized protein Dyak_GE24514 [Drosophila yakuba]